MDFNISFNLEINKTEDKTDDAYDILEIFELIHNGWVSTRKDGDELSLIDTTRGNISIGKITNVELL
jgi:hypothetical protein